MIRTFSAPAPTEAKDGLVGDALPVAAVAIPIAGFVDTYYAL